MVGISVSRWRILGSRSEERQRRLEKLSPKQGRKVVRTQLIAGDKDQRIPRLVGFSAVSTLLERAWPTNPQGIFTSPDSQPIRFAPFDDPDRLRLLPWVPPLAPGGSVSTIQGSELPLLVRSMLVFIIIPAMWMVRGKWRWLLAYLGSWVALTALMALAALYFDSADLHWETVIAGRAGIGLQSTVPAFKAVWRWRASS